MFGPARVMVAAAAAAAAEVAAAAQAAKSQLRSTVRAIGTCRRYRSSNRLEVGSFFLP